MDGAQFVHIIYAVFCKWMNKYMCWIISLRKSMTEPHLFSVHLISIYCKKKCKFLSKKWAG